MPAITQYQNVFRIAKNDSANGKSQSRPGVQKRNRKTISCLPCRTRKLKCDRQTPCLSCSKRGEVESCDYSGGGRNDHDRRDEVSKASEAQRRLQQLEEMVSGLVQSTMNGPSNSGNSVSSGQSLKNLSVQNLSPRSETPLKGHINGSDGHFIGGTHWATILENIRDIQGVLGIQDPEEREEIANTDAFNGPDIIFGQPQALTHLDFYNILPPRAIVDRLISFYFNAKHLQLPVIHPKKFIREYESFWADPSSTSLLWISILFSISCLGCQIYQATGQKVSDTLDDSAGSRYFTAAGQALIAGEYHRGRPCSVEAVLFYALCKVKKRGDADSDSWMVMGTSARLALKMGYHRDPRHLAHISPFEAEMRRRIFYTVETFDLLLCFQAGIPAIIHHDECDTEPPSNLLDTDFDEDSEVLPPSRPPTDPTPMLYYCTKSTLARVFRGVIQHAVSPKTPAYEETMILDEELHRKHNDIPPILRTKPLSLSLIDGPDLILERLNLELLYLRCVCVLHRNYLRKDRSNPTYDYSRKTCIDAALQVLKHEADLHFASQPGGQLYNDQWMISNLILYDFLLAAMIICVDLYESHDKLGIMSEEEVQTQIQKYDALRLSYEIWVSRRPFRKDAIRASSILSITLAKVSRPNVPSTINVPHRVSNSPAASFNGGAFMETSTDSSSSPSWNIARIDTTNKDLSANTHSVTDLNSADSLTAMFTESDFIDWGLVDQYLLDQGSGDLPSDFVPDS